MTANHIQVNWVLWLIRKNRPPALPVVFDSFLTPGETGVQLDGRLDFGPEFKHFGVTAEHYDQSGKKNPQKRVFCY